jgi:hypothetical protein
MILCLAFSFAQESATGWLELEPSLEGSLPVLIMLFTMSTIEGVIF